MIDITHQVWISVVLGLVMAVLGCSSERAVPDVAEDSASVSDADEDTDSSPDPGGDTGSDSDGDADADSDADTDTDADGDTDADTDADTDSFPEGDTDTNTDTDTDGDTDSDTDTDIDADVDGDSDVDTDTDADSDSASPWDTDTANSECKVPADEFGAIGDCTEVAPPDSFEPEVQWTWNGLGDEVNSDVTPLVANLTDDNGDGHIDLCDIPDVVVVARPDGGGGYPPAGLFALDGATGAMHFRSEADVTLGMTPALGDIDGDGLPEIVSVDENRYLIAFEHDGTFKWRGTELIQNYRYSAVGLADIDADGDVEIIVANQVFDHEGALVWEAPTDVPQHCATTAADLDGAPGLEVVLGHAAYHADGSEYYLNDAVAFGFPQVADLDGDGLPEVLVMTADGISVLENDGTAKFLNLRPIDEDGRGEWDRAATIHDFDGDGEVEFAISSYSRFTVYEADATILWSVQVTDGFGAEAATAFDFLGDGIAEAMFMDMTNVLVFDESGDMVIEIPREVQASNMDYPVVADVDNDGSAEIVVIGRHGDFTVKVIRDVEDRWIQARRIWNQHTYHVTNVREDGTIPQVEPRSWELFNTFRTNIQIENGALCHTIPMV